MPSPPSLSHPASDPNLSNPRMFPHKPSPSSSTATKLVAKLKLRRRSSSNDFRTCDLTTITTNNNEEYSCYSPYYKGLTDQSLAVNYNELQSHHGNINTNNLLIKYSPYYKGLTDFSLVLHGRHQQLTTSSHDWRFQELEGAYECSPYYRGLTDYSLAIREFEIGGGGGYGPGGGSSHLGPQAQHAMSSLSSYSSAFTMNLGLCLGCKDEIFHSFTEAIGLNDTEGAGGQYGILPSPRPPPTTKGKSDMNVEVEAEGKPLGERVSEEMMAKAKDMDMENKEVMMNEYGLDFRSEKEKEKKKPLRESISISDQRVSATSESESSCKDGGSVMRGKMKDIAKEVCLKEYLWANKYQPKALEDFICHRHMATQLQQMVEEGCACNHFIFQGPAGAGKRCMIRAMLREVFGRKAVEVTEERRTFKLKGELVGSIQVGIKRSAHHVEVNLSETRGYEKQVIEDLFREVYDNLVNNSLPCVPSNCQAIIIYEAEKLSTESLLYTKWMLERYKGCSKVFFCCSDEAKLQLIKPLCTTIRLSPPSTHEIVAVLEYIAKEEGKQISQEFLMKIVEKSKNNLRQAIRSLEATCQNKESIKEDELILTGWEDDISNIAKNIIEEQSPKQLYIIHIKLQSLMIHNVSPDFVYKSLVSELNSLVNESLSPGFAKLEKEYTNNVYELIKLKGVKQSGHGQNKQGEFDERNNELRKKNTQSYLKVEEFIAKFMSWYKNASAKSGKQVQVDVGT